MLTLDEAIKHCEEKAKELRKKAPYIDDSEYTNVLSAKADCLECAKEHEQLAQWLKELKVLKERPQGDLISRQLVIDAMNEVYCHIELIKKRPVNKTEQAMYLDMVGAVKSVPTEERPQGEWIYGEDDCDQDGWFCSECNFFAPYYYQYYKKDIDFIRDYKVCPHCLAEMVTYTGKDTDKKGGAE